MKVLTHLEDQDSNLVNQNIKNDKQITKLRLTGKLQNNQFKCNTKKTIILIAVISLLFSILFLSDNSEGSSRKMTENIKKTNSQSQDKTALKTSQDEKQSKKDEEEQFSLKVVNTNFKGKQMENTVNTATLAKMQQQIFKIRPRTDKQSYEDKKQKQKLQSDIKMLEVMIPDNPQQNYTPKDFFFFSVSIHQMILNSQLDKMYRRGTTIFKVSLKQHMRAIIRTQLVHNVNFKGQIQPQLSPFDKSLQQKKKAIKQIMQDQQLYYQSFYQINSYKKKQLRFCILIPSYNNVNSKLYLRNLDSIFMQDYQNYHVVYIDDASPDKTGQFVKQYIKKKNIPEDKIKVYINERNRKALFNIYHGIHQYCPDKQIVGLIDGDDSLLGRKVLQVYNAVYQKKGMGLVYSNFLKILTNNRTSFGFGTQITRTQILSGKMRNDMSLVGTHFMTFYSDIFKKIKKQHLCYENGTFFDYAYDRAIITPMIEMAFPRVHYLPEMTYQYRNDTGINDGTEDWERVSKLILKLPAYEPLQKFDFIESEFKGSIQ